MNDADSAPFAEQVLQEVRNAERGGEGVGGVVAQAEVVREDALADQPGEPAEEDAGADQQRAPALARSQRGRLAGPTSALVKILVGVAWPSVPLDFFIRYVLMNRRCRRRARG